MLGMKYSIIYPVLSVYSVKHVKDNPYVPFL